MNDFAYFFELGWQHIISSDALDHQLFILALAAIYLVNDWKKVLILVTAFTIGHSLTLALSAFDIIKVNSKWVEFLIPLTIVITALFNFIKTEKHYGQYNTQYFIALFFGLIHGLGFANTIKLMLAKSQSITMPLLSFNLGLEAGQIVVVAMILLISFFIVNKLKLRRKWWVWALSAIAFFIAGSICIERWPF
ncbi:MAG: HupE/UreJ family protein [Sphingobacteriales bacterium]|nr:MAG: HupE/UreJ family protein [Sphingobacteriales bacterium]